MKVQICFACLIWLIPLGAFPQCSNFTVYSFNGNVSVLYAGNKQPVTKNLHLNERNKLEIGSNSRVILLAGDQKAIRLEKAGSFTYTDLQNECRKNITSLTSEYVKYIAESVMNKDEPATAMVIKAAVYRSQDEYIKAPMLAPPDSSVLTGKQIAFAWKRVNECAMPFLTVVENDKKVIMSKQISDTVFHAERTMFMTGKVYSWVVSPFQNPPANIPKFHFVLGEKDWENKALDELDRMMMPYNEEHDSVVNQMQKDFEEKIKDFDRK